MLPCMIMKHFQFSVSCLMLGLLDSSWSLFWCLIGLFWSNDSRELLVDSLFADTDLTPARALSWFRVSWILLSCDLDDDDVLDDADDENSDAGRGVSEDEVDPDKFLSSFSCAWAQPSSWGDEDTDGIGDDNDGGGGLNTEPCIRADLEVSMAMLWTDWKKELLVNCHTRVIWQLTLICWYMLLEVVKSLLQM